MMCFQTVSWRQPSRVMAAIMEIRLRAAVLSAFVLAVGGSSPLSAGDATPGATLIYDAAANPTDDMTWFNIGVPVGSNFDFALDPTVLRVEVADPGFGRLTHAFNFPGGYFVGGLSRQLQALPGNPTNNDASFEVVFRSDADSDSDVVYETGANADGVSLIFDESTNELRFTVKDGLTEEQATASGLVSSRFIHAMGVINLDDCLELWINGELADVVDATGIFDWGGANETGLGRRSSAGGVNEPSSTSFEGDISIVRFYEWALTESEITDNFCSLLLFVDIAIKPFDDPAPINLGASGLTPIAIASTDDFDALCIAPETVDLAGAGVAIRGGDFLAHPEDVDGDGLKDLVLQLETEQFDLGLESGTVTLTGLTCEGRGFLGFADIVVVPPE